MKYIGRKGEMIEVTRVKRPLSAIRASGGESTKGKLKIKYEGEQDKFVPFQTELGKAETVTNGVAKAQDFSADQVELLEKIGALVKCKAAYYPPTIEEVEYFVKNAPELLYDQHYSNTLKLEKIDNKISQEIQDFGLSAYRNNLQLTAREECVVLLDWFQKMKGRYSSLHQQQSHKDLALRNQELILSFCVGELIRISKIECMDRGLLLQRIWEEVVGILKNLELQMVSSQRQITRIWKAKFDEMKTGLEKELTETREKLENALSSVKQLSADVKSKDEHLKHMTAECASYKDRGIALSSILDHMVVKNVAETKKYNKGQKKLMSATLLKIRKDHDAFKRMELEGGFSSNNAEMNQGPMLDDIDKLQ